MTSGYVYGSAEEAEAAFANKKQRFIYSRFSNPTVQMFEDRMALLEGAEAARATATGMAAVFASLACQLRAGDRVVASDALFGSCQYVLAEILPRFGVETVFVDGRDLAQWRTALSRKTQAVFVETPSNPGLRIIDLPAVAKLAHAAGAKLIVDNVFATPLLQRPLEMGADIVVYSATKHIDGQGRSLGGVILGAKSWVEEQLAAVPSPYRPGPQPDERLAAAEGAGDPGASRLAPLQQCGAHRRFPGPAEEGRASFSTPASPAIPSMRWRASR